MLYSDILCSEECQTKKLLVCCRIFAFFKAIFKFCTAKKLLMNNFYGLNFKYIFDYIDKTLFYFDLYDKALARMQIMIKKCYTLKGEFVES